MGGLEGWSSGHRTVPRTRRGLRPDSPRVCAHGEAWPGTHDAERRAGGRPGPKQGDRVTRTDPSAVRTERAVRDLPAGGSPRPGGLTGAWHQASPGMRAVPLRPFRSTKMRQHLPARPTRPTGARRPLRTRRGVAGGSGGPEAHRDSGVGPDACRGWISYLPASSVVTMAVCCYRREDGVAQGRIVPLSFREGGL